MSPPGIVAQGKVASLPSYLMVARVLSKFTSISVSLLNSVPTLILNDPLSTLSFSPVVSSDFALIPSV